MLITILEECRLDGVDQVYQAGQEIELPDYLAHQLILADKAEEYAGGTPKKSTGKGKGGKNTPEVPAGQVDTDDPDLKPA